MLERKLLLVAWAKNKIVHVTKHYLSKCFQRKSIALLLLISLFACGCSSFNREWRQAGKNPVTTDTLAGRWEGHWSSDANGHSGKLRCLVTPGSDGDYAAQFRASYLWVLRFNYTVSLKVQPQEGSWLFQGDADLGKLGGVYHYEGSASSEDFHSTYRSQYDHGIFQMKRLKMQDQP